jgi:hypothetical protein
MPGADAGRAGSGAGLAWSRPGMKKVAGETLCVLLMPLQPPVKTGSNRAGSIAKTIRLHFNSTHISL